MWTLIRRRRWRICKCREEVLKESDYIGSTSGIIQYAARSDSREFIVCTETGVRWKLEKDNPEKKFYFTKTEPVCRDMKLNTLEKLLHVLKTGENAVEVDQELQELSKKPLVRMLELA